jgi:hypothetical protein
MTIDYKKSASEALARLEEILPLIESLRDESDRLVAFIGSIAKLLPPEDAAEFRDKLLEYSARVHVRAASLTGAVKNVLIDSKEWMTVVDITAKLTQQGFDFSEYKSNPAPSVSTTLRRLLEKEKPEIEAKQFDGTTAYRWKRTAKRNVKRVQRSIIRNGT